MLSWGLLSFGCLFHLTAEKIFGEIDNIEHSIDFIYTGQQMSGNKLNFTLTQIEYALAVHKYGHFAKAAEACHVTQPTLSMQIRKLEELLGVSLFDRSKKPILLTDAGRRILEQFQVVLFEAKKIETILMHQVSAPTKGLLSLGVIPTIAPYVIPRLLPILEKLMPQLELRISELQTKQILAALQNDELDVGLLALPLDTPQILENALYFEPFYLFASKNHPLTKLKKLNYSDLTYKDIWLLPEGHCLRNQILDICSLKTKKKEHPRFEFESGSLETIKSLVRSYGGYTLLPQLALSDTAQPDWKKPAQDAPTRVLPFERPIPARQVGLVYQRRQYKTNLIQALGEAILKSLPENIAKLRQKDLDLLPIE